MATTTTGTGESQPQRVVSLLGAASETLFRLGVGDKLVGRSHECDYPPAILSLPCISRPRLDVNAPSIEIDNSVREISASGEPVYKLDDELIGTLNPDLLIAQDHCRVCAVTPQDVANSSTCSNIPQLVLRPATLAHCMENITQIANVMGVSDRGKRLRRSLEERFECIQCLVKEVAVEDPPRVALLEWCNPIMGCGYWLPELVTLAGGTPLHCPPPGGATPSITFDTLIDSKPDVVIFALCGFGLSRAAQEINDSWNQEQQKQLQSLCCGRVFVVDGNYLINRSGPRVVESCEALAEAIHPDLLGHFDHFGTDHLSTLEAALRFAKDGTETGSKKLRPEPFPEPVPSGLDPAAIAKLPTVSPTEAAAVQLEYLRTDNMTGAFAINSEANQSRWCNAARFKHVMESHDIFRRLLSEKVTLGDEMIQGKMATVVVSLADDKNGKVEQLIWTMVCQQISPGEPASSWRTEKVGFV